MVKTYVLAVVVLIAIEAQVVIVLSLASLIVYVLSPHRSYTVFAESTES